ncbi:MAG TPA: CARDB domain-containing protein [Thermoanaerobaculia bacterium]|nr:CARDB domain-containing protein [Thermoanaerobaculia bacterium]
MKKTILAVLILGTALTAAASDQSKKPATGPAPAGQTAAGAAAAQLPKPDFRAFADGQYIFVMNGGDADWTGPLDVKATCKKEGTKQDPTICGPNFPNGSFFYHIAGFQAGHGPSVAPIKGSGNAQQVSGYGWRALRMDLPPGSYEITVTVDPNGKVAEKDETNNQSVQNVSIAGSASPGAVQVNPGAIQLAPTKKP